MKIMKYKGKAVTITDDMPRLVSLCESCDADSRYDKVCRDIYEDFRFIHGDTFLFFNYGKHADGYYKTVLIRHSEGDCVYLMEDSDHRGRLRMLGDYSNESYISPV